MGPEAGLPATTGGNKKVRFPNISSRAFEHPADRAALAGLRKVPGFDIVLRKLIGLIGERSLRYLFLGSAVRVNAKQYPLVNKMYEEALDTLDFKERPELFVAQTPFVNAGAIGVDKPFIVLNSGTVMLMNEEEVRFILGHELGHILSDHVLYKTMFALLMRIGISSFGIPFGGVAMFAVFAALAEWHRKSEVSCDRCGLLVTQDKTVAYNTLMKMAGGTNASQMNVDEFLVQAEEYDQGGNVLDSVLKLMNLLGKEHPLSALRVLEMRRFAEGDEYKKILAGDYPKRDDDPKSGIYNEFKDGAKTYQKAYAESKDPLVMFLRELGNDLSDSAGKVWDELRRQFGKDK
jgi:Zn-dependent protease with chaperone function